MKKKFLIWSVIFLVSCGFWFFFTIFVPRLFTGLPDWLVNSKQYSGFFFIVLLLSLIYPLFVFWRSHVDHADGDDRILEKNNINGFFVRHFVLIVALLLLLVGGATILFEYLAYHQGERIKKELVEATQWKAGRLNEWRSQHRDFALLSDRVSRKKNSESIVMGRSRPVKMGQAWPQKREIENQVVPQIRMIQKGHKAKEEGLKKVEIKFLNSNGVVSVKSSDEVSDEALPRDFIERVLQNKTMAFGPMSHIREEDGKEYTGFCMAVPVMNESDANQVKSIMVYRIDPSGSLYPYLESSPEKKGGGQMVLLQKEPTGLRVLGNQTDKTVLPDDTGGEVNGVQLAKTILGGRTGFVSGIDVRGEPVVAYVVRIADSDWFVAQQIDRKEIIRQTRQLLWVVILSTVFVVSLIGGLLFLWLRHRHFQRQAEHLKLVLQQQTLIQHYDFLSKYANDIILLTNNDGTIIEGNDRAEAAYGYPRSDLLGRNIRYFIASSKMADFETRWSQLKKEHSLIFETVHMHIDGSSFPVEISARMIETEGEWFVQCIIRDITEKKRSEELIWRQANFDQITGLANRRMFMEVLHHEIRKASRTHRQLALMFLDLDKFKDVNDTLGHAIGDLLLQQVAERLKLCIREVDMVARLGGDEFTVILSDLVDFSSVKRVAENILVEMAEPFILDGNTVQVSSSIGITFFPEDADNIETLLKNADQAMYAAKNKGGNCYQYFTRSMQESIQKRFRLISDLRNALDKKQFEVAYQPVLNLVSGRIDYAEALIRWHHPVRGLISPSEFIPLAEETGIIQDFSDWVFLEAAHCVRKWRTFIPDFKCGLNISPVQFKKQGIDIQAWFDYLNALNLSPSAMVIEIREGLLPDLNDSIVQQMLKFRDAGIAVALDNFGTGYSLFSYLTQLDIDYLKIDQSFISHIVSNENDRTLCEAITLMAHKLGIKVIAEGVEHQNQMDILVSAGFDYAQGVFVSKVLSAEECEAFLRSLPGPAKETDLPS